MGLRRGRNRKTPEFVRVWHGAGSKVKSHIARHDEVYCFMKAELCRTGDMAGAGVMIATYRLMA